jgi:prepilin-type N-terminal cleavage/methylation domain-containing protein
MLKRRQGFTLIELLIVIVIIGILAAIAIPKFGATREKAYLKAMMSDLRNLQAQQELYYSNPANNYTYAEEDIAAGAQGAELTDFAASPGVSISITLQDEGWSATATHEALDDQQCGIFVNLDAAPEGNPATVPGVVACAEVEPAV